MTEQEYNHIPRDAHGIRRSKNLPSRPSKPIILTPRIEEQNGTDEWERRINDEQSIIVLDLFSGAGGMSYGFVEAGFFIAAGVEEKPWPVMTHGYNFLSRSIQQDICTIEDPVAFVQEQGVSRVDVIIGGPPCQGFSLIGRGKLKSLGLEKENYYRDVINNLYQEFTRFVKELNPLVFVMENVPAMYRYNSGELVNRIVQSFEDEGYKVGCQILNAVDYDVPQRRQRLFIQGNRLGMPVQWPQIKTVLEHPVTVSDAIGDLPPRAPGMFDDVIPYVFPVNLTNYQQRMRKGMKEEIYDVVWDHITRHVREDDKVIFELMKQGDKYRDLPDEWKRYSQKGFGDKYWRLYEDRPSWTITAHIAKDAYRYIHPTQHRTLSVREFARLQSFPDHFRFCGPRTEQMRQIGNAVPPMLAQEIASCIREQIIAWREKQLITEHEQAVGDNVIR